MLVLSDKNPLDVYVKSSEMTYKAVAHTLGVAGTNTAVANKRGSHDIINDGYTILKNLTSVEPDEAEALETIKLSAFETNRKAGDGTTSTTLLTYKLLSGAKKYIEDKKVPKVALRNKLEEIRDEYIEELHTSFTRELKDDEYEYICKVSLGGVKYANLISEAYRFLDEGLRPTVVRGDIGDVVLDKKDGIVLDKVDVVLPKDELERGAKEFNDVDVYLIYEKLDRWNMIQPIVEQIIRLRRKVILFYNELSIDIMQNLQLQIVKGYADIIPIRLGSLGIKTRSTMEELSLYTNATLIDGIEVRLPKALKDIKIGNIDNIILSTDTVILNNKGFKDKDDITLPTKSCIIRVGGKNQAEQEERYRRIEDAVNSLGNAIESGISIGGGITYQNLAEQVSHVPDFVKVAMSSIYEQIIYNMTGSRKIDSEKNGLLLTESGEYVLADTLKVYDATKVIEQVIINAFSLVAQIITTDVMIVENVR